MGTTWPEWRNSAVNASVTPTGTVNEPDAVRGIAGIKLLTGVEDFIVQPFEAKAEI